MAFSIAVTRHIVRTLRSSQFGRILQAIGNIELKHCNDSTKRNVEKWEVDVDQNVENEKWLYFSSICT